MDEPISLARASPLGDTASSPKRRKLRKGTQSCWECKRRKARCSYSAITPDTCEGCKRRGTDCISQDVSEQPPPPGSNKHIVDRLGQVEALVGQLLKAAHQDGRLEEGHVSPHVQRHFYRSPIPEATVPLDGSSSVAKTKDASQRACSEPEVVSTSADESPTPESHDGISRNLLAAWPSQYDMDIILGVPIDTSQIIRTVTCVRSASTGSALPSAEALLQLPPPGSHPTLIARKLLVLATFVQGMPSSSAPHLEKLSVSYGNIMSRAVKTAHKLVTSNDELVASLEGVECIMLEGLYENYAGELKRSWLAARRAVMISQMLGLNRGVSPTSLAGLVIKPDGLWFRIVQFDRYLSLMLGLPQCSVDESFASPEALESCTTLETMLRVSCVAAGRLLQRTPAETCDPKITKDIDKLLQDASAGMPAQWWVPPNLLSCTTHEERISETLRFNDHFVHYHLLLQLHMPYIIHSRCQREYDYNRMAAVTASREILARFRTFRTAQTALHYCRGVDMVVFISAAALCLAHICDRRNTGSGDNGFPFLAHQRLSDRGILEGILKMMEELTGAKNDAIAARVATLLQHLLAVEEDAASGTAYDVAFAPDSHKGVDDFGYRAKLTDNDTVLSICLPQFWVVEIRRKDSGGKIPRRAALTKGHDVGAVTARSDRGRTPPREMPKPSSYPILAQLMPGAVHHDNAGAEETDLLADERGEFTTLGDMTHNDWVLDNLDFTFFDGFVDGSLGLDVQFSAGEDQAV
ncbi:hypothetical protein CPLU01_15047 [Colletotrichum plurivorum]|uniref:Zn(2)-C6 fungal-type domain-containing protein n=1 Tax=Colletotrichum plurivorum TaxID=2175906 RepID=A0A8H6JF20_9PEZI|nr:hypothetical protein CPLU01_15047 [Colletotrichum plurivorum]